MKTKKEQEKQNKEWAKKENELEDSIDEIRYELDTNLDSIPHYAQDKFLRALSYLPEDIREKAISECIFMSCYKRNGGFYYSFKSSSRKGKKGFIFFNPLLWDSEPIKIDFYVAHEIAHFIQDASKEGGKCFESFKQEKEADKLAIKWLKKIYKKEELLKICSYFHDQEWEKWGRKTKKLDEKFRKSEKRIKRIMKKYERTSN